MPTATCTHSPSTTPATWSVPVDECATLPTIGRGASLNVAVARSRVAYRLATRFRLRHLIRLRSNEWVPGPRDELTRWALWSRARAVVSHESALGVHGLGEFESPRVHLTVPPGFTMRDDAVIIPHAELPGQDIAEHTGFRATTPLRTIIDIASNAPDEDQLARTIDDARQAGLVTGACADIGASSGGPGDHGVEFGQLRPISGTSVH